MERNISTRNNILLGKKHKGLFLGQERLKNRPSMLWEENEKKENEREEVELERGGPKTKLNAL